MKRKSEKWPYPVRQNFKAERTPEIMYALHKQKRKQTQNDLSEHTDPNTSESTHKLRVSLQKELILTPLLIKPMFNEVATRSSPVAGTGHWLSNIKTVNAWSTLEPKSYRDFLLTCLFFWSKTPMCLMRDTTE